MEIGSSTEEKRESGLQRLDSIKIKEGINRHRVLAGPYKTETIFWNTVAVEKGEQKVTFRSVLCPPEATILDTIGDIEKMLRQDKGQKAETSLKRQVKYAYLVIDKNVTPYEVKVAQYPATVAQQIEKLEKKTMPSDVTKLEYGLFWMYDLIIEKTIEAGGKPQHNTKYDTSVDMQFKNVFGTISSQAYGKKGKALEPFNIDVKSYFTAEELKAIDDCDFVLKKIFAPATVSEVLQMYIDNPLFLDARDSGNNNALRYFLPNELQERLLTQINLGENQSLPFFRETDFQGGLPQIPEGQTNQNLNPDMQVNNTPENVSQSPANQPVQTNQEVSHVTQTGQVNQAATLNQANATTTNEAQTGYANAVNQGAQVQNQQTMEQVNQNIDNRGPINQVGSTSESVETNASTIAQQNYQAQNMVQEQQNVEQTVQTNQAVVQNEAAQNLEPPINTAVPVPDDQKVTPEHYEINTQIPETGAVQEQAQNQPVETVTAQTTEQTVQTTHVQVSADVIKRLRDKTGYGMAECSEAITDAGGNYENAKLILQQKSQAQANQNAAATNTETPVNQPANHPITPGVSCNGNHIFNERGICHNCGEAKKQFSRQ